MNTAQKSKRLSEEEIDEIVIAQADDDTAWEEPVSVRRTRPITIVLSPDLAVRATFLARLHQMANVEEWLQGIIEQRIDFEEAAFAELKKSLTFAKQPHYGA